MAYAPQNAAQKPKKAVRGKATVIDEEAEALRGCINRSRPPTRHAPARICKQRFPAAFVYAYTYNTR